MTSTAAPDPTVLRLRPDRTERLEALHTGRGPHVVEVLDVGTAANGDLLLELPVPVARLVDLVAAPGGLTAGEAVTVLVPLAQALHRLHDAGVALGGIGPDAVVLDADGSPSWTPAVEPALIRRVGPMRFADRAAADVAAFRGLCGAVLRPLGLAAPEGDDLEALARALYALAPPEPVRLSRSSDVLQNPTPARLLPAVPVRAEEPVPRRARRIPPAAVASAIASVRSVRPRAWIALGGVATALLVAFVALPSGGDSAPAAERASSPAASPRASSSRATPSTEVADRALGGQPAIAALLAERDRCLAAGSESCLRRVDAAGSPVLQADLDAVRAGTDAVRVDRARLRVSSGGGATALATSKEGATVLAVREQNGWRLRDVVAEPPATR